jgi:hypothetical protein
MQTKPLAEERAEGLTETEAFIAKGKERLRTPGPGESLHRHRVGPFEL